MKRLTVGLLVFNVLPPAVFAQAVEQKEGGVFPEYCIEIIRGTERQVVCENTATVSDQSAGQVDRQRVWSVWQRMVEGAERVYKNKNGHYGDLVALRRAHLLQGLIFEPCSSAGASGEEKADFVPKGTLFQVTVSKDRQHFNVEIVSGAGHCYSPLEPLYLNFPDSLEGPLLQG